MWPIQVYYGFKLGYKVPWVRPMHPQRVCAPLACRHLTELLVHGGSALVSRSHWASGIHNTLVHRSPSGRWRCCCRTRR